MNRIIVLAALLVFVVTQAFAADFAPTLLNISAPSHVQYAFDGTDVKIPVTLTGTPANVIFLVYTKDKASQIEKVQNGHLGWHYVDKVDTCVYAGTPLQLSVGSNDIVWNGKNSNDENVDADEYNYYIWGFDNVNFKVPLTKQLSPHPWHRIAVVSRDDKGEVLPRPIILAGDKSGHWKDYTDLHEYVKSKWIVGNDPLDETLVETTKTIEVVDAGGPCYDPTDFNYFYTCGGNNNGFHIMYKWEWVPNGDAVLQTDWGEEGKFTFANEAPPSWDVGPGVISDGGDYLLAPNFELSGVGTETELIYVDRADGTEVQRYNLAKWWLDPNDAAVGGQAVGGPCSMMMWGKSDYLIMGCYLSCMKNLFDVAYEDEEDAVMWVNQNGDYTSDKDWAEDAERPWTCNDNSVGPYMYNTSIEDNGFTVFPSYDMGAVSFGLLAPDGTGLSYHALAAETAGQKYDTTFISGGTAYDGLLVSNQSAEDADTRNGWFWVGQDSFAGVISSKPTAVDEAPADFAVAQNSPNPFNPTTTISFSIADAGNVTIDIYNVAGQNVDTIANEFMGAGSHSFVWDASGFSAGVYFYTVKSGDFNKTMKMTLLK